MDNLVDSYIYGKPVSTKKDRKYKDFQEFVEWCRNVLCKSVFHEKNPHVYAAYYVDKHVDNVDNFISEVDFPRFSAHLRHP